MPKIDQDKVTAEIKEMQHELRNLQDALAELLEAIITEEKPGPKEIKKLKTLKKKALNGQSLASKGDLVLKRSKRQKGTNPTSKLGETNLSQ